MQSRDGGVVGLLVVDGWIAPEDWSAGYVVVHQAEWDGVQVVRASRSGVRGRFSTMEWHLLVTDRRGIEHFTEHHELGLFTRAEYVDAFERGVGGGSLWARPGW